VFVFVLWMFFLFILILFYDKIAKAKRRI
jgi:hypothetical protein